MNPNGKKSMLLIKKIATPDKLVEFECQVIRSGKMFALEVNFKQERGIYLWKGSEIMSVQLKYLNVKLKKERLIPFHTTLDRKCV